MIKHRQPVIEELMTPGEVAREAGVNPRTVSMWHRRGKLTAVRTIGRHRRFRRADVLAYLATRRERAQMLIAVPAAILIILNIAAVYETSVRLNPAGLPLHRMPGRHRREPCPCRAPHPVRVLRPLPPYPSPGPARGELLARREDATQVTL